MSCGTVAVTRHLDFGHSRLMHRWIDNETLTASEDHARTACVQTNHRAKALQEFNKAFQETHANVL